MTGSAGSDTGRVDALHAELRCRGETVAVAESLTAGLLAAALTGTPGSTATFRGGLVVYATDLKTALAGVPADLLARHGPVSGPVAAALAEGVAARLTATYGVGVTGVAGPDEQDQVGVGTVYVGVAGGGAAASVTAHRFPGDREAIRAAAVTAALHALADRLGIR